MSQAQTRGTLLPPSVRGRGSGETQGQTTTCSNPECHTDTPGWHREAAVTPSVAQTPPAGTEAVVSPTQVLPSSPGTWGSLHSHWKPPLVFLQRADAWQGGSTSSSHSLTSARTTGGQYPAPSPLPRRPTPPRSCLSSGAGGSHPRPAPSMAATRPVAPQWARGRPLGQGLEAQTMQAAGPRSDAETRPSWETVAPSSQPTPSRSVQPHGPHWVHR